MVIGEQIRAAVMAAELTHITSHECSICGKWVFYTVQGSDKTSGLYFHPACGCCYSPPEPRTWDSVADWINMQDNEVARTRIMAKFGMMPGLNGGQT